MNILIIDDDAVDRMAAVRTLRDSGLSLGEIIETDSADEGIQFAQNNSFDVILLDYQLPPTNGIEVLRLLRGIRNLSTAIVMLSHSNDENLALQCIEAGAQDFLMKVEVSSIRLKRAILLAKERYHLEQQIRISHEQLRQLAEQDSLTGLSNRYFFDEALKDAISNAQRDNKTLGLLLLDLDHFKNINDTLGHAAGDQLLKEVASRLQSPIREGDKLCRLGGDEFAILIQNISNPEQIRLLIKRIFDALQAPMSIEGKSITISISVGIAIYPDCATNAIELMKCADVAMYRAKADGRNQFHYYSKTVHEQMQNRVRLEHDLSIALQQNQFELYYQPQVDSKNFQLIGVEVLIRWHHPELGLVPPGDFIPIAEESGLINDIGQWVLDTACQQFGKWLITLGPSAVNFSIAVNLSARQLKHSNLIPYLKNCIDKYAISPMQLELELTESTLDTSSEAMAVLKNISEIGIILALDDFGTGYSSLSHLQEYPFKVLKIDKKFVQVISNEEDQDFLRAIIAFAHSLKFETVAEGVETEAQKELCSELGIHRLQGYYFSKPLPLSQFEEQWIN